MLLLNIGALVWGASRLATNLEHVARALDKLTKVVDSIDKRVYDHETRLTVIEKATVDTKG